MGPGLVSHLRLTPSRPCACDPAGSVGTCDPNTGHCACKERVEGHLCNRSAPWYRGGNGTVAPFQAGVGAGAWGQCRVGIFAAAGHRFFPSP